MKEHFPTSPTSTETKQQSDEQSGVVIDDALNTTTPLEREAPEAVLARLQEKTPETPETLAERIDSIETDHERMLDDAEALVHEQQKILSAIMSDIESLSSDEQEHIEQELEKKGIIKKMQDLAARVVHAHEHAHHELSHTYNERTVNVVNFVGKCVGGVSGLGVGMAVGGGLFGGAVAAIAGSKAGGYGLLKSFDRMAKKTSRNMARKITQKTASAEMHMSPEQSPEMLASTIERTQLDISEKIDRINHLDPDKKQRVLEKLAQDPRTKDIAEKLMKPTNKYREFWHGFEKKYPTASLGLEFVTHVSIPLATKGMLDPIVVEKILLGLESVLAGGASEKMTAIAVAEAKAFKQKLLAFTS
ncbi:MAG: hypothetical protein LRY46_01570 [Candidatus Pacebacteria bacterium]|nr:hypothetical protein [Candidatus Paceibacterota bacterium]